MTLKLDHRKTNYQQTLEFHQSYCSERCIWIHASRALSACCCWRHCGQSSPHMCTSSYCWGLPGSCLCSETCLSALTCKALFPSSLAADAHRRQWWWPQASALVRYYNAVCSLLAWPATHFRHSPSLFFTKLRHPRQAPSNVCPVSLCQASLTTRNRSFRA